MLKRQPFKKIASVLRGVAPTAVAALSGPYAPLALNIMKRVFGDESMNDEQLENAVLAAAASPADFIKLKEIEAAMQAQENALHIRFAELEVEDRKSARAMAIETSFWPQVILSVIFVGGYFVTLGLFFSEHLTIPDNDAFTVMLGVLTAGVPQIMNFWMGSSVGSKGKGEVIAKIASGDRP